MSNHSGSYLLNEVLHALHSRGVFALLGDNGTREFVRETLKIGREYDCNYGEILERLGATVGICIECAVDADDIDSDDICGKCRASRSSH